MQNEEVYAWLHQLCDEDRVEIWIEQLDEDYGMVTLEKVQPSLEIEQQPTNDKGLSKVKALTEEKPDVYAIQQ